MEPSHNIKSLYGHGSENEAKNLKENEAVESGGMMEDETRMEIALFSAVVSAALIFLVAYYFIYINTQSQS